jgi:hypothetical protein
MELLLPLVKKPEVGLKAMNPKGDGDCTFAVHCSTGGDLKLHFEEAEVGAGAEVLANTMLALHVNGGKVWLLWTPLFMLSTETIGMEETAQREGELRCWCCALDH